MKNTINTIIATGALAATASAELPLFTGLEAGLTGRARYESVSTQGAADSTIQNATFSVSPYFKTADWEGFSAFIETEHTMTELEDYAADPVTDEVNQAYVQYSGEGITAKVGRQKIILDGAAFVGNVGWRQNEQTFDAASLSYKSGDVSLFAAYADRVNRIFGSEASGALKEFKDGGVFMFNAKYKNSGAYTYLIDFDQAANSTNGNTYGGYTTLSGVYMEAAYQEDTGNTGGTFAGQESFYGHIKYSAKAAGGTGTIGLEYLGSGFNTPLATVHAYNGFADVFTDERLFGKDTNDGIADFYASYVSKSLLPYGLVFKGFLHYYMDEAFEEAHGWEADAVIAKKLSDNVTLVNKMSYFFGDNGGTFAKDKAIFTTQLDFKF